MDYPQSGDENISVESLVPNETVPSQSSTTAPSTSPKQSPTPQYCATTHRGKRTNTRVRIVENLERRETERNEMMKALLAEDAEDDIDLFFKSIAKSVKKLTPALQQRAKLETLGLITKLETEMWHPSSYLYNSCEKNRYYGDTSSTVSPNVLSPYSEVDSSHRDPIPLELNTVTQPPENFHHLESL